MFGEHTNSPRNKMFIYSKTPIYRNGSHKLGNFCRKKESWVELITLEGNLPFICLIKAFICKRFWICSFLIFVAHPGLNNFKNFFGGSKRFIRRSKKQGALIYGQVYLWFYGAKAITTAYTMKASRRSMEDCAFKKIYLLQDPKIT